MELSQETITWAVSIIVALSGVVLAYKRMVSTATAAAKNYASENHKADIEAQGKFRDDLMKQVEDMRERISSQERHISELSTRCLELEKRCEQLDHHSTLLLFALDKVAERFPETVEFIKEQKSIFFTRAEGLRGIGR